VQFNLFNPPASLGFGFTRLGLS